MTVRLQLQYISQWERYFSPCPQLTLIALREAESQAPRLFAFSIFFFFPGTLLIPKLWEGEEQSRLHMEIQLLCFFSPWWYTLYIKVLGMKSKMKQLWENGHDCVLVRGRARAQISRFPTCCSCVPQPGGSVKKYAEQQVCRRLMIALTKVLM